MLADLGADVIKVERPILGDYLRTSNMWIFHVHANRHKRSIALDLHTDAGKGVYRLLETTDVVVTNAIAEKNVKLGIDYETLRARKPRHCVLPEHGVWCDRTLRPDSHSRADDGFARRSHAGGA